ncbi:hypothetical protein ASFV_Kyiv_2016_131_00055 [African swine fever virus]|uniref:Uncharacterized protein n=1 Tax=African swine fever virus TaxID=10497 RepID=A0A5B8XA12_ASF|nr:hypothetical protein ASFV_Kyiv_2016_131_00055 [African swine fever virus]
MDRFQCSYLYGFMFRFSFNLNRLSCGGIMALASRFSFHRNDGELDSGWYNNFLIVL